jgi:hypothetical protein
MLEPELHPTIPSKIFTYKRYIHIKSFFWQTQLQTKLSNIIAKHRNIFSYKIFFNKTIKRYLRKIALQTVAL